MQKMEIRRSILLAKKAMNAVDMGVPIALGLTNAAMEMDPNIQTIKRWVRTGYDMLGNKKPSMENFRIIRS